MPFIKELQSVYEKIKETVEGNKLSCLRGDDIFTEQLVIEKIWENINKSWMIIADATYQNANVFYEIGLAHAIGKPVIIITQNEDDITFNLRNIGFIKYENNEEGLKEFRSKLSNAINRLQWVPLKINEWIKTNNKDIRVGLSFPTDNIKVNTSNIEVNTSPIECMGRVIGLNNEQLNYRIQGFVRLPQIWLPDYEQGTSHIDKEGFWKIDQIHLGATMHKLYFKIFDEAGRTIAKSTKIKVIKISR